MCGPYRTPAPVPEEPPRSKWDKALDFMARLNTENPWARKRLGGHWERGLPYTEYYIPGKWQQVPVCTLAKMNAPCSRCFPPEEWGCTLPCLHLECEEHGAPVRTPCPMRHDQ